MPQALADPLYPSFRPLNPSDFLQAKAYLSPYLKTTPLRYSDYLSELTGAEVWLKLETLQPTGSFKVRGALHKLISMQNQNDTTPIVTASAGNHGLGLAYAAKCLARSNVTIFLPQTAPKTKLDKLSRYPISLQTVGQTYEEAHQAAETFALKSGATYVSDYNDSEIILGQGTCGLEILSDLPKTDIIFIPTGGGGLLSGIALVSKGICPDTRVIAIQPEASPAAKLSFEHGNPVDPYKHAPTIADGLAGGFGSLPYYYTRTLVERVLLYKEVDIKKAIFTLVQQEQLIVEPSGAIAIAPLLQQTMDLKGRTVVCVLTGANLDTTLLSDTLTQSSNCAELRE